MHKQLCWPGLSVCTHVPAGASQMHTQLWRQWRLVTEFRACKCKAIVASCACVQWYRPVTVVRARYEPMSICRGLWSQCVAARDSHGYMYNSKIQWQESCQIWAQSCQILRNFKTLGYCHVLVHLQVLAADPITVVGFGQGTAAEARVDYKCKSQGQGLLRRCWTGLLREKGWAGRDSGNRLLWLWKVLGLSLAKDAEVVYGPVLSGPWWSPEWCKLGISAAYSRAIEVISSEGWWEPQIRPLGTTVTPAMGLTQVASALLPCSYSSLYISAFIYRCVHAQLCPTLCDPIDCNLPGSSVHRILQARILEWVAISSYRGSSLPRDRTCMSCVSCITGRFAEPSGKSHL